MAHDAADLQALERELLDGLREDLGPSDGVRAFEQHQLLAIRFHRVARLAQPMVGEGRGWRWYFDTFFPRGGEHGHLLWTDWRVRMLKDDIPGKEIVISHGQPEPHWQSVLPGNRLFVNLESMWDDYEESVRVLLRACQTDNGLRRRVLSRFASAQWRAEAVSYVLPAVFGMGPAVAVSAYTASAAAPMTQVVAASATMTGTSIVVREEEEAGPGG